MHQDTHQPTYYTPIKIQQQGIMQDVRTRVVLNGVHRVIIIQPGRIMWSDGIGGGTCMENQRLKKRFVISFVREALIFVALGIPLVSSYMQLCQLVYSKILVLRNQFIFGIGCTFVYNLCGGNGFQKEKEVSVGFFIRKHTRILYLFLLKYTNTFIIY